MLSLAPSKVCYGVQRGQEQVKVAYPRSLKWGG